MSYLSSLEEKEMGVLVEEGRVPALSPPLGCLLLFLLLLFLLQMSLRTKPKCQSAAKLNISISIYINISKIKSVQDGREYVWKLQQLFILILSVYTLPFLRQHNETSNYAKSCF